MPGLKERAKTLVELLDSAYYLYAQRPLHLDEKAASLLADGRSRLAGLDAKLDAVSDWSAAERGGGRARACGGDRGQARPGGAAASGGAHRTGDLARVSSM